MKTTTCYCRYTVLSWYYSHSMEQGCFVVFLVVLSVSYFPHFHPFHLIHSVRGCGNATVMPRGFLPAVKPEDPACLPRRHYTTVR